MHVECKNARRTADKSIGSFGQNQDLTRIAGNKLTQAVFLAYLGNYDETLHLFFLLPLGIVL